MTNEANNDPLAKLIVSESQPISRQELAELLLPYVSINRETKTIDFSSQFMGLQNSEKILIILAAIKARNLVIPEAEDKISPLDIIKMQTMPEGSVKATLKMLLGANEIRSENSKYYLPNYKVAQVVARFNHLES